MIAENQTKKAGERSVEASLRLLVSDFSTAPLVSGKKMRDLLSSDREGFRLAAVSILRASAEVRASRYLVTLLWSHDLLIPTLSDVTLPKELSLSVARNAAKVDSQLHVRVIRYLVTTMLEGQELEESAASRLLEVLSSVTDAVVIRPFLRQMLLHPSPRIRSKITLLVGRGQAGFGALSKLASDEDARVRANAVEALWRNADPQALQILRESLKDPNNRVVGNAIFGLYLEGDLSSVEAAIAMMSHESAVFRATAAWIMGRTKDPRFLTNLGKMLTESKGQLRKTVFNGVDSIKKAAQTRAEAPPLNVTILGVRPAGPGRMQVAVSVSSSALSEATDVKATEFILLRGKDQVQPFTCSQQSSDLITICLVLPRRPSATDKFRSSLEAATKSSLYLKKRVEQWCVLRYREESKVDGPSPAPVKLLGHSIAEQKPGGNTENTAVNLTTSVAALQTAIESPGLRYESGWVVSQAILSVMNAPTPAKSTKHIVVFSDGRQLLDDETRAQVARAAAERGCCVHAFCEAPDLQFEALCNETSGFFYRFDGAEDLSAGLKKTILSIRRQYVLECEGLALDASSEQIGVQVHTASAFGEGVYTTATQNPETPNED